MAGRGKRFAAKALALIMCLSCVLPVYAASTKDKINDTKDKISDTKDKINNTKDKIDNKKDQVSQLANERKELEKKLEALKKEQSNIMNYIELLDAELNGISEKLISLEDEKTVLENDIAVTQTNLENAKLTEAEQYESMKARIKYMYENGNENILELLLNSEDLKSFLNRAEYIEKITQYDREMLDLYVDTRVSIEAYEQQLLVEMEEQKLLIEIAEAELMNMEMLIASKEDEMAKYYESIADNEKIQDEIDADWDKMNDDLAALEKDLKKQQEQLEKEEEELKKHEDQLKKEEAAALADKLVIYDGGQFIWPLKSNFKVTSPYGYRTHPISKKWKLHNGIDIAASTGTPILSAYDGVVATVAYTSAAGNYIMVNHGNGIFTVYMHCHKIIAKKGQKVKKGDTIALVGSTGSSTAPHLHFSVRLNGSYVDPSPYIGYKKQ